MLAIVGTIPDPDFPFIHGKVSLKENYIFINNFKIDINRCTPALIASAIQTMKTLKKNGEVYAFLAGDTGLGKGSNLIYEYLIKNIHKFSFDVVAFHYLQPNVDFHNRVIFSIEEMKKKPILIADAGFMYAAKMSGLSEKYDFFTPDAGEIAFLADELAPHPFYTRGFILHDNNDIPDLIKKAYKHSNAAKNMIVKGETDYIVCESKIIEKISSPSSEAMEAIGGTGDTLTGILSALIYSGITNELAGVSAAKINRHAGVISNPTPETQIKEIIGNIPKAVDMITS